MVTKEDLVKIAREKKLPLGIIEKDFVLTHVLKKIYESSLKNKLVFKGGTALHKLYLHKRISMDLDFTELEEIKIEELKKIIQDKEINSEIKEVNETPISVKIILSYNSLLEHKNSIILDISKREKPILELIEKKLESPYFEEFSTLTFQLEELVAEKIRALIQRNKPRDYLDIYYLLNQKDTQVFWDIEKAMDLAKQKLQRVNDTFEIKRIFDNLDLVKSLWEQDLREILPGIPEFEDVIARINENFKEQPND
jgi:uncharacterized protein